MITDEELADELIGRLNKLIENPAVRKDIGSLIDTRVGCSGTTRDHATIQVVDGKWLGLMGVLNGLVGIMPTGHRQGWGYIAAEFSDDGVFERFKRTTRVSASALTQVGRRP
jgi:hypothetical protein